MSDLSLPDEYESYDHEYGADYPEPDTESRGRRTPVERSPTPRRQRPVEAPAPSSALTTPGATGVPGMMPPHDCALNSILAAVASI